MIKKIFFSIILYFLTLISSQASMFDINKVQLLVEYPSDKSCNVDRENIETSTKYILSNSKIKFTTDFGSRDPLLYIQPIIMESGSICFGAIVVLLKQTSQLDPEKKYNVGDFVYYYNNTVILKSGKERFKNHYIESVEQEIKKFVVKWSEDNK
jgi:hypothetical protein